MMFLLVIMFSVFNDCLSRNVSDTEFMINESLCLIGPQCGGCPSDRTQIVERGDTSMKVCCPNCGRNLVTRWKTAGEIICECKKEYEGNCWTGLQCEECLLGPNKNYVGFVDGVYLCCPKCERFGKSVEAGDPNKCNCIPSDEATEPKNDRRLDPNDWKNIQDPTERMTRIYKTFEDITKNVEEYNRQYEKTKKLLEKYDSIINKNIKTETVEEIFDNEVVIDEEYDDEDEDDDYYEDEYFGYDEDDDDDDSIDDVDQDEV